MKERSAGLDLVRVMAIACVMGIHAISYTGVMDTSVTSPAWIVYLIFRFIAMSGVPLFLMLSGYLCCDRKFSGRYYVGIIPILISYLFISVATILFSWTVGLQNYTLWTAINGILNYTAHDYGWYVEMYIGLFLLIPFLNAMFEALQTKRARLALVLTLSVLTFLPPSLESFRVNSVTLNITADYWRAIYPMTYYFIGAYLRKHPPVLSRGLRLGLAIAATALPCIMCYIYSRLDGAFAWYVMNGFSSITAALTGLCYFLLFFDFPVKAKPIRFAAREIAVCSFEMYLFSFITDYAVWRLLARWGIAHNSLRLVMQFAISFVCAYVVSRIFRFGAVPLTRWLKGMFVGKTPAQ